MPSDAPAAGNDGRPEFHFELPSWGFRARGPSKANLWLATGFLAVGIGILSVLLWWASRQTAVAPAARKADSQAHLREQPAKNMRSDAGERAYRHLLKSTVFLKSSTSCGSGALVDRRNRLVLTNSHVVKNDDVSVAFPPPTDAIEAQ